MRLLPWALQAECSGTIYNVLFGEQMKRTLMRKCPAPGIADTCAAIYLLVLMGVELVRQALADGE